MLILSYLLALFACVLIFIFLKTELSIRKSRNLRFIVIFSDLNFVS